MEKGRKIKRGVIIGAGPAGITASIELLRHTDIQPLILEESNVVGGLSKSIIKNGYLFDIGPHRFFSKRADLMQWWADFLPLEGRKLDKNTSPSENDGLDNHSSKGLLIRQRFSRIYYRGKFFNYPVSLSYQTLRKLGFLNAWKAGIDYLWAHLSPQHGQSLEDFYRKRFGTALYRMFFEKYTEKVWGKHPSSLSADWGSQRVSNTSPIASLFKKLSKAFVLKDLNNPSIMNLNPGEHFLYPKLGAGQMWETVAASVNTLGGVISLEHRVTGIQIDNHKVVSVTVVNQGISKTISCDYLISSMPLSDLVEALRGVDVPGHVRHTAKGLPYRAHITVCIVVERLLYKNDTGIGNSNDHIPDHWIYIQEEDVKIGRIFFMNNFSPYIMEPKKHEIVVGVEYFCSEGDEIWNMKEEALSKMATQELVKIGCIREADVIDVFYHKEKKAYPSYHGGYYDLSGLKSFLDTIENLYCIGRNGQHRYNNMDHSMLTAMEAVKHIAAGNGNDKTNIWNVNTEMGYHEGK